MTFIWPGTWGKWWSRRYGLTKADWRSMVNSCWFGWHEMAHHSRKEFMLDSLICMVQIIEINIMLNKRINSRVIFIALTDVHDSSLNEPLRVIRELSLGPCEPSFLVLLINQRSLRVCSVINAYYHWDDLLKYWCINDNQVNMNQQMMVYKCWC